MVGVSTAAVGLVLYREVARLVGDSVSRNSTLIDLPVILPIGISLHAIAIGAWLNHSTKQILVQITLCCLWILGGIWIAKAEQQRLFTYWLQISFTLAVVLPLLARRHLRSKQHRRPFDEFILSNINIILFSYLNFVVIIAVLIFQLIVLSSIGWF